eukprot:753795-Pyramimonas_sp.AAC.1
MGLAARARAAVPLATWLAAAPAPLNALSSRLRRLHQCSRRVRHGGIWNRILRRCMSELVLRGPCIALSLRRTGCP